MKTRLKIICFLFILFFPGKAYSDSNWWNYFDYAGVTWSVEEFRTIGSGMQFSPAFTPGRYSDTINDGEDVHTDTSIDIFLGKKFGRTSGEINYVKNNFNDLRTSFFKQAHYLNTDFDMRELNFNGFYNLFQSKRLNFSIGGGTGIAYVKMSGETYRTASPFDTFTRIMDGHKQVIFTYNVSVGLGYRFAGDYLLDIRGGYKEFMDEIKEDTYKVSTGLYHGNATSDLSSNFIKFRLVKEF